MGSKREEERNEKIIRGLMKLPPNRRCINCNNLGPQYVCTNFWTFICMICSGIHREFTHRVKSVSMSKFTAQEVEALQNGGNQRAREIFLKDWDLDRQRQPNSSNVDKVREFIKSVYIDLKYAGGNNFEKPPKDLQSPRNAVEETRRASSYHSFSQSPPYDFQYEDRLNRKHAALTRKPGSDHLYERNAASFMYSSGRFSAHFYEDRYANEASGSRVSDYSLSSGGDPFKSAPQSPNLQKDDGFSSPASDSSREIVDGLHQQISSTFPDTHGKEIDKAPLPRPQRSVSSGCVGSFEKNSLSFQSSSSGSLFDVYSEPNNSNANTQNKASTISFASNTVVENAGALNLFDDALAVPTPILTSGVELFQAAKDGSFASMDLFQSPAYSADLSQIFSKTSSSSSSSFISQFSQNRPVLDSHQNLSEPSDPSNEGWATFDIPQPSPLNSNMSDTAGLRAGSEGGMASENLTPVAPSNAGLVWPNVQHSTVHSPPSLVSNPWNEDLKHVHVPIDMSSSQTWKAFDDGNDQNEQFGNVQGNSQVSVDNMSSDADQFVGFKTSQDSSVDGLEKTSFNEGFSFPTLPSHVLTGSSFVEPMHPFMGDVTNVQQKFGNPFDVPFEETHNKFLDLSTLQAALPNASLSSSYIGGLNDPWFSENHVASPGGMPYMTAQAPNSQLQNVPTQGPVASVGGNPFA